MTQAVNANIYFPVTAAVLNTGTKGLSFAGVFLTENTVVPAGTDQSVLNFTNAADVKTFFGATSVEYTQCAIPFFKGFDNSFSKPTSILFARYVQAVSAAGIFGNKVTATVAQFAAVSAGTLTLHVNGLSQAITGIDLTGLTSYSGIATALQTDIRAASEVLLDNCTVTYDAINKRFIFSTGLTTGTDTITWATTGTLAGYLGWQTTADTPLVVLPGVGYLTQGSPILTPAQNMDNVVAQTLNFASFTNVFDTSSDTNYVIDLALSQWANDNGYAYFPYNTVSASAAIVMTDAIVATDNAGVVPAFATLDVVAFSMGMAACVDYNRRNSVIAWAWKSQDGLVPTTTVTANATAMIAANCNFYQKMANAVDTFNSYQQGKITGQFGFIQNFFNQMWLGSSLQAALIKLFQGSNIIDYSSQGYASIYAALQGPLEQGLINRVITTGNTFSPDQVARLISEAGSDISGDLSKNGYYILIQSVTGDQRASNTPPPTTVWYTNGGVILTLPLTTVFVE